MRRAMLPFVLGLLGFGLFVTSVAMAASGQPVAAPFSGEDPLYGYDAVSPTNTISHPVALAITNHFSDDLAVTYDDVIGLHADGYGFGVIAKIYFITQISPTVTVDFLLDEFDSGKGWGEILKELGFHPGVAGRGGNLGGIMSNREDKKGSVLPPGLFKKGASCWPPGHCKNDTSGAGSGFGPSSLKASDEDDDDDHGGGPPITPPGQLKKGNKGKGKK
jgi:hypothetical protein